MAGRVLAVLLVSACKKDSTQLGSWISASVLRPGSWNRQVSTEGADESKSGTPGR